MNGFIDHLHTPLGTTLYRSQRLGSSVNYSLQKPFPGKGFYRGRFFSFEDSGPLVTTARAEILSTENWMGLSVNLVSTKKRKFSAPKGNRTDLPRSSSRQPGYNIGWELEGYVVLKKTCKVISEFIYLSATP
jgi:hypothetical protein